MSSPFASTHANPDVRNTLWQQSYAIRLDGGSDRQTDRQTDGSPDRQADRQADRAPKRIDIYIYIYMLINIYNYKYICINIWSPPPPPRIYACMLCTISCLFTRARTRVISTDSETTVDRRYRYNRFLSWSTYNRAATDLVSISRQVCSRFSANKNITSCFRKAETVGRYCKSFAVVQTKLLGGGAYMFYIYFYLCLYCIYLCIYVCLFIYFLISMHICMCR